MTALQRIVDAVAALPLRPGMRVLEIGCGPGAALRLVAARIGPGLVLGTDRSATAIGQASKSCAADIAAGTIALRQVAAEDLVLQPGDDPFDLAFALRVGALDGRYPALGERVLARLAVALKPDAPLFIDGGDPLRRIDLRG